MDHEQRACPRCGELTGNFYFCPSCRAQLDSSAGVPADEEASAHATREVLRVDQTLSAGGHEDSAGEGGTAVQVEAGSDPVVRDPSAGTLDIGKVPHREVARLEDVLKPNDRPEFASGPVSAIHSVPPPSPISQPAPDLDDEALERAKRELTRLEQLLRVSPGPDQDPTPTESATPEEAHAQPASGLTPAARSYVAAHRLRSAFLFEQTAAFEQALALAADEQVEEIALPASVPPPVAAPPAVEAASDADQEAAAGTDHSQLWLGAACLLALIALVVALTGRRSQRCRCS